MRFGLTEEEYGEVGEVAAQAGMAKGAYAAYATLAAARGLMNPADAPFRQALTELIRAAGLVRRIGVNLNVRHEVAHVKWMRCRRSLMVT